MDIEAKRKTIKEEFRYYLSKVARSSRVTDGSFYLSYNAVNSYLSFLEVDKLFDYAPQKWSKIKSIYDITDIKEIEKVAKKLLSDPDFIELNKGKNNGWRSGSIMHYVCFINARNYFSKEKDRIQNLSNAYLPLNLVDISPRQIIYYGAPGTGKSHTIKKEEDAGLTCIRTTFHPDSDYSTFVGCYKPHKCRETETLTYEFVPQAFLEAYTQAWLNPQKEIALVIEEINRGNCAQIFGDIFQLLDRDEDGWSTYPIKADTDIAEYLEQMGITGYPETLAKRYGREKTGYGFMALPPNMSILATMNTSDQSLFPIDSAFKRRWDWKYVPICQGKSDGKNGLEKGMLLDWKIETSAGNNRWWNFLRAINGIIESTTHSEDKELGFFFCKANKDGVITADKFVNKVVFYLWTDVFKTYGFRSDIFNKDEDGQKKLAFKDFFNDVDGTPNVETVKLFVENVMKHLPKENVEE